jgi:hypothetical protein
MLNVPKPFKSTDCGGILPDKELEWGVFIIVRSKVHLDGSIRCRQANPIRRSSDSCFRIADVQLPRARWIPRWARFGPRALELQRSGNERDPAADSADGPDIQVPDEPAETCDNADSGPPAIGVVRDRPSYRTAQRGLSTEILGRQVASAETTSICIPRTLPEAIIDGR